MDHAVLRPERTVCRTIQTVCSVHVASTSLGDIFAGADYEWTLCLCVSICVTGIDGLLTKRIKKSLVNRVD